MAAADQCPVNLGRRVGDQRVTPGRRERGAVASVARMGPRAVIVIGAGFGGLGAARALLRAGHLRRHDPRAGRTRWAGCGATTPTPAPRATYRPRSTPGPGRSTRRWGRRYSPQPEILDYLRGSADREGLLTWCAPARGGDLRLDEAAGPGGCTTTDGTTYDADVVVVRRRPALQPGGPGPPGRGDVRRAGLPLRRLAPRRRPRRQAGRGDRHRRQRDPVRARHRRRGRRDDGVPALGAVRRRQARPGVPPAPPPGLRPLPLAAHRRAPFVFWLTERINGALAGELPGSQGRSWRRSGRRGGSSCGARCKDAALRRKLVPDYPIGCKRVLFSNDWYPALDRDHVDVVTDVDHRDRAGRRAHVRRPAARGRRADLGHRVRGHPVPGADARSPASTAPTCTSSGPTAPAHTSASRRPGSPTCSSSTAPTPTSAAARSSG